MHELRLSGQPSVYPLRALSFKVILATCVWLLMVCELLVVTTLATRLDAYRNAFTISSTRRCLNCHSNGFFVLHVETT